MPLQFSPCETCPPCVTCTVQEDDFTRADNASLGGSWTETDWAIDTDAAETATDDATAIGTATNTDANGVVTADFTGADFSDEFKLIISWEDASNYLFAVFTLAASAGACGSIKLYSREGGTNTQLGLTRTINDFEPDVSHSVGLCRDGTRITAFRDLSGVYTQIIEETAPASVTGTQAGFASGTITASLRVDNYQFTKKDTGCRACTNPCEYLTDDFNRSDNADPGCEWLEVAGTSAITSNQLSITASNTLLVTAVASPGGNQVVTANITGASNGDVAQLIVRYTDSNNYLIGEIAFGSTNSTLTIRRRIAGTTSFSGSATAAGLAFGDTCELRVCFYGTALTAEVYKSGALYARVGSSPPTIPSGKKAGIATGAITSSVVFDDFVFQRHNSPGESTCEQCQPACSACDAANMPQPFYLIDLGTPSLTNNGCDYCDQIGGEYYVTSTTGCSWVYCEDACDYANTLTGACPTGEHIFVITLNAVFVSSGVMKWQVLVDLKNVTLGCGGAVDPSCGNVRRAVFESSNVSGSTRCTTMPVTLSKVNDHFADANGVYCDGSMPSTITLSLA